MDLQGVMLSGMRQTKTDTRDLTHVWNLKNGINEQTQQKQTRGCREQTDGCQMGGGWRAGRKGEGLGSTNLHLQNRHGMQSTAPGIQSVTP